MIKRCILFFSIFFSLLSFAERPNNYWEAKNTMLSIFQENPRTLYCQCLFDRKKRINPESCGLTSFESRKRARRVEAEHMMPAENFGRHLKCWRENICISSKGKAYRGRKCCQETSREFRLMEGELYNLWPADGLVNQLRSNYRFSEPRSGRQVGDCDFWIDTKSRKVIPSNKAKGIVARATLFMSDYYKIPLSKSQRLLFNAWHKTYPPSPWEKKWAKSVAKIEGYHNQYIEG